MITNAQLQSLNVLQELPYPFSDVSIYEEIKTAFFHEALTGMRSTDIFSTTRMQSSLARLKRNRLFSLASGRRYDLISDIDGGLQDCSRIGIDRNATLEKLLKAGPTITVSIGAAGIGAHAILEFLRLVRGDVLPS